MKLPQLSLRELFLLVALVAMGCGWWVDRRVLWHKADWLWDAFIDGQTRDLEWQRVTGVSDPEKIK